MKKLVMGILAHVDAGKTTLSEALLYQSGSIRKPGRVDKQNTFLDTHELERARGITIYSKQAVFKTPGMQITLMDTPGHVDFSAEMERTLQVLDYAVLVLSAADGVQGHTRTVWRLLKRFQIPVFLFVNKMDLPGASREKILALLQKQLDAECVDFTEEGTARFHEAAAMCDEAALESYLDQGSLTADQIAGLIRRRKLFPCYFGSALRQDGVKQLLRGLESYTCEPDYPSDFGARVFKITRDDQGNRLTHMKITGGSLKVRSVLPGVQEKVNQIRLYSGNKYEMTEEAEAGCVCSVTGPAATRAGEGLGREQDSLRTVLEPVLTCRLLLPQEYDAALLLPGLYQLEEEEPQLHIVWQKPQKEIQVQVMGEVQMEILQSLIAKRFGVEAEFTEGSIVYKETIAGPVEGVGHYEPLRHYAEVHLLLEPGEPGSGLQFATACSGDLLDGSWQRQVLHALEEAEPVGVLTGSAVTDMKVTLVSGRAHPKHTEGGDFRQAAQRALRQGLMKAHCILLEPWYEFRLEVPVRTLGRAMSDLDRRAAVLEPPLQEGDTAVLCGSAPAASLRGYQREVLSYTGGTGRLSLEYKGYEPCHNVEEIMDCCGYEPERDVLHPAGSVFCSHGAGELVPWDRVEERMHLPGLKPEKAEGGQEGKRRAPGHNGGDGRGRRIQPPGTEEVDRILERTFYANRRPETAVRKGYHIKRTESSGASARVFKKAEPEEACLLVDGYNMIFAWEELRELAKVSIDGARGRLMDLLCNYQAAAGCKLILVFDAYRVAGHETELLDYQNIQVVYTGEEQTADQYIERFAHENHTRFRITVATSDGLEQIMIRGQGCALLSARGLWEEMERTAQEINETYRRTQPAGRSFLLDAFPKEPDGHTEAAGQRKDGENTKAGKGAKP